jgi:hypothetical protein
LAIDESARPSWSDAPAHRRLLALEDSAGIGTQIINRCIGHERILADVATLSRGLVNKKLQEL